jgi:hypothetical protein
MSVAVRRRHAYDVRLVGMRGQPDTVLRDSFFLGTALSAPLTMMIGQILATGLAATGRGQGWAIPALGLLGATMVAGYLAETLVRLRLRPSGWDAVESSIAVAGTALSGLMAVLSARCLRPRPRADGQRPPPR